jgi:sarcosine oxidase subunit beta
MMLGAIYSMKANVLVVGGGVMGVSAAMFAARQGDPLSEPVVLLERDALGSGSSGRSEAILCHHNLDRSAAFMAKDSIRFYQSFLKKTGQPVGLQASGVLLLAGPRQAERLRSTIEQLQSIGVDAHCLTAAQARERVPGLELDDDYQAVWEPKAGTVGARQTIESMGALARYYGAATRIGVSAEELVIKNGHMVGVETSAGFYESARVVLAAGPHTKVLLAQAGIDLGLVDEWVQYTYCTMPHPESQEPQESPEPVAEHDEADYDPLATNFEPRFIPAEPVRGPLPHPVVIDLEAGWFARCEREESRTRVGQWRGSPDELKASGGRATGVDGNVTDSFRSWAHGLLRERFPLYRDQAEAGSSSNRVVRTADGRPLIGAVSAVGGLFVATGFAGHEFQLAPSVGEGLAQLMAGKPVSAFHPELFSPDRLQTV